MDYLYRIVVNEPARWPELDREIVRRGAKIDRCHNGGRVCIYRVPLDELPKLPTYNGEAYLGNDDSGFSLYPMDDVEAYKEGKFCAWEPVTANMEYPSGDGRQN